MYVYVEIWRSGVGDGACSGKLRGRRDAVVAFLWQAVA